VNYIQKAFARLLGLKAVGFPSWNSTGPWPSSVLDANSGGNYGALQLATVYGCIRVRGQTIGSLPFHVYREDKSGERTKAIDHWLYPLLHDSPNAYQTSMEFREAMERAFCLWGNAYAGIEKLGNRVVALNFLRPDWMQVQWDLNKKLVYHYTPFNGVSQDYAPEQVLHVKNFGSNQFWGDSPIRNYAINHAIEAQNYGRFFLQNLGRPGGYLKFKTARPTSDDAAAKLRADWQGIHGGPENAGKTAVLWNEAEYVPLGVPPDEAQYIQTRNFSIEEIAGGIFGVPLNLIGHTDKTATYASAEHFDIAYVKHTVRPQCVRYEQAFNKALLRAEPGIYCEHDLDGLLRGDSAAQAAYYATVHSNSGMTANEFRRKMNLPASTDPGADELMIQSNMIPLRLAGSTTAMGGQGTQSSGTPITSQVKPTPAIRPVPGVKP
jgi:HK97 family phage portal protein